MSTYNGEHYIVEQMESILNQENVELDIYVRDDGSSDKTIEILKNYQNRNKIRLFEGENLKPAKSFMKLLYMVPEYDYYAFADQDDFWEKNKLKRSIDKIEKYNQNECSVYFSNVKLVDKNLNELETKMYKEKIDLASSFIVSPAIGCTLVINNKMREKIIEKNIDNKYIGMHDSWIYRIALAINANIIYDYEVYNIKYRQHENNVIGIKKEKRKNIKRLLKKRNKTKPYIAKNILELYYDDISEENIGILKKMSSLADSNSIKDKIKIIFDKRFASNNLRANIKFYFDILKNCI